MVVKSVDNLKELGINYDKSKVWVCKNCGFSFIGIDEDRKSGKFGLCPDCYDSLRGKTKES
jgi:rubrerythrin